jgi:uncharacterized membrane protein
MVVHFLAILLAVLTPITYRLSGVENGNGSTLSLTSQEDWKLERAYIASIVINTVYVLLEVAYGVAVSLERSRVKGLYKSEVAEVEVEVEVKPTWLNF